MAEQWIQSSFKGRRRDSLCIRSYWEERTYHYLSMVLFASDERDGDKEGASEVDEEKCLSFEVRTTTTRMRIRSRISTRYRLYNSVSSTDHTFDAWSAIVSASTCQQYHAWEDKLSSHHIQLQTFFLTLMNVTPSTPAASDSPHRLPSQRHRAKSHRIELRLQSHAEFAS